MTGPVSTPDLLAIVRGLLVLLVAGYLVAFRPFDRRSLWLVLALALMGARAVIRIDVQAFYDWHALVAFLVFLAFLAGFPQPLRWRAASGAAVLAALLLWAASAIYLATNQLPAGDDPFQIEDFVLAPQSLGWTGVTLAVVLTRLRDLRDPGVPENEKRAAPFLYVISTAGVFTGAGFLLGQILGGLVGSADFPSFFYRRDDGPWYAFLSFLVWYALPAAIIVHGLLHKWRVPLLLFAAGFASYLPVLAMPDIDPELALTLQLWGYILSPAFVMYAQARWAPFKGEPDLGSGGWLIAAFAAVFAYAFALIAIYAVTPNNAIAFGLGPILALGVAVAMAMMVLPRARKAQLGRMFALANHEPLAVGSLVLGRYRVLRILGEGGQARVYEATDKKGGERVVLKALANEEAANEAGALKELHHPNIIRLIDVVEVPGVTLLVLEFADGGTLRGLLKRRSGGLPTAEAKPLLDGILAGLEASHAHGLAHRDVKPENILLARGVPKLADFGVARATNPDSTLRPGRGTLAYLAPEQIRGEPGDARSDVYAAGMLVHEVLTGRSPVSVPTDDFLARQAILHRPPKVTLSDKGIARVIERALGKEPGSRFKDAADLRAGLQAAWSS